MAEAAPTPTPAPPEERGDLTIADKVVERIASIAAREVEEVADMRAGWTRMYSSLPKATAKVAGGRARIGVEVAAAWPSSLPGVTAEVRDHVNHQISRLTGVTVVAVDVTIADVIHLETNARRVR
ncbi:MAG: Asp23/Gls24 family envelope stress response protein [Nocardioides sp.]